ncbi:MAG: hypothetical protein M1835_001338 [Candelina submexicana]|nr:MAG: hypothetical protein M1835_001338 [Candelina submexicana]
MPVDWKKPEAYNRLLAAVMAAHDMKLDYRKIASMYGEGATYDAIEGRFRIVKKEAQVLKEELESGVRAPAPARGQPVSSNRTNGNASTSTTPKKARKGNGVKSESSSSSISPTKKAANQGVLSGRVTKSASSSAKGKKTHNNIKLENQTPTPSASFASSTGAGVADEFSDLLMNDYNAGSFAENGDDANEDADALYEEEEEDAV